MDIGSKLREKRQDLGLSADDVSARTLINIKYINALEENRFSDIPAEAIVLGFLRNYSVILGLNPDEVTAEYKKINPVNLYPKITRIKIAASPSKKTVNIKIVTVLIALLGFAFLLGLIEIISNIAKSGSGSETASARQTVKKNHLEIQTTDNVWIRIRDGENPTFEGIIPPNTIKVFDSAEQFSLRIGNLSGLTVTFNGAPVELPKGKLVGEIKIP